MTVHEIYSNQELLDVHQRHRSIILCVYDHWRIPNSMIPGTLMERLCRRFPEAHFIKAKYGILADYYDSVIPLSVPHIVIYTNYGEVYSDYELSSESSAEGATRLISDYVLWTRGSRRRRR